MVRSSLAVLGLLLIPASGAAEGVAYACLFQGALDACGFRTQAGATGRATVVEVAGMRGVRLHTRPGDSHVYGSRDAERTDLALSQRASDCYQGREHWWAHSVLFPDDYVDPPESTATTWNFGAVADFHNTTNGAGQANFQVTAMPATAISPDRPTGLNFQINYGDQTSPTQANFPIGPVIRNQWYNFVYHVKWSSTRGSTACGRWLTAGRRCIPARAAISSSPTITRHSASPPR
jgi:hypothetical protein